MMPALKPTAPQKTRPPRLVRRRTQALDHSPGAPGPMAQVVAAAGPAADRKRSDRSALTVVDSDRHLHSVPAPAPVSTPAKVLAMLHVGSSWVAGLLVLASLGTYSYSVHVERQLQRTTSRLQSLKRSEQQLTTVNEVLKNHIAQQIEVSSGSLRPPRPGNVIFLQPTPPRAASIAPAPVAPLALPKPVTPLGY